MMLVVLLNDMLSLIMSLLVLVFVIQSKPVEAQRPPEDQGADIPHAPSGSLILFLIPVLLLMVVPQLSSAPGIQSASYRIPSDFVSHPHTSELISLAMREQRAEARCMRSAPCRNAAFRAGLWR
jgi:Na+/H+ antiporter NhaD/arsenite permease-like protein